MSGRSSNSFIILAGYNKMDKKQAFLDNYANFDGIMATCEAIDINHSTYWRWMQADEVFSKQSTALKKEIDAKRLNRYELELDKRA